jgi:hypothetical protein
MPASTPQKVGNNAKKRVIQEKNAFWHGICFKGVETRNAPLGQKF